METNGNADKIKRIEKYYDNTQHKPANKNIIYFINKIKSKPGKAIELGCGAGRDTVYLIKKGWDVLAIDQNDVKERITSRLTKKQLKQFRFSKQKI